MTPRSDRGPFTLETQGRTGWSVEVRMIQPKLTAAKSQASRLMASRTRQAVRILDRHGDVRELWTRLPSGEIDVQVF